ncbi:MAG: hypothetical protein HAW63_02300 [Bdellovibrionaceae bacterium]|nr:hypothetical protein [Pseudobdellovibrionaceae bacterium]
MPIARAAGLAPEENFSKPPTVAIPILNIPLTEEVFVYKGELPYGKLEKRQEFLSWPILNREGVKTKLLEALKNSSN